MASSSTSLERSELSSSFTSCSPPWSPKSVILGNTQRGEADDDVRPRACSHTLRCRSCDGRAGHAALAHPKSLNAELGPSMWGSMVDMSMGEVPGPMSGDMLLMAGLSRPFSCRSVTMSRMRLLGGGGPMPPMPAGPAPSGAARPCGDGQDECRACCMSVTCWSAGAKDSLLDRARSAAGASMLASHHPQPPRT